MRVRFVGAIAAASLALSASAALAQHSDVEFGYEGGMIAVEFGSEGRVFEGDFGDFPDPYATDDPGFGSEVAEGLGIGPNDVVGYNVLGPLLYHNGTGFAATGETLTMQNAAGPDVLVTSSTLSGFGYIGQAGGSGDFHEHIDFSITNTASTGAYGVLVSLSAFDDTLAPNGIADSLSFYLVYNLGLDEEVFEGAVGDFAALVPEPTSVLSLALGGAMCGLALWRKKRRRTSART